jgi:hypothetical protein
MNIEQILIDKANNLTVHQIKQKYNLSDEVVYAIMWCIDGLTNDEILQRLPQLKSGMK